MTAEQVVAETRAEIEKLDAGIAQWDGVYREANNEYKRGQRRARGIESIDMDALLSGEEIAGVGSARMDKLVDQARDASHRKTLLEQGRAVLETAHQKAKDRHARELAQKREKAYRKAQQRLVGAVVVIVVMHRVV